MAEKTTKFDMKGCEILNSRPTQSANSTRNNDQEKLWHRRFGHLGEQNLRKLAREELVEYFNYDVSKSIGFWGLVSVENIIAAHSPQVTEPLELVHSDVCGTMSVKSLEGAEYFLAFTDDYTRFTWT